ncbi:MAG: thiol-activated cytolysin family protein [Pirellulaceae bacterium]
MTHSVQAIETITKGIPMFYPLLMSKVGLVMAMMLTLGLNSAFSTDERISDKKRERREVEVNTLPSTYNNGIYCTSRTIRLEDSFEECLIGPKAALNEIVYPGAMIYMDDFLDGSFNVVACERAPITVYSDFYDTSGEDNDISQVIDDVSSSGIASGIAELVNRKGETRSVDSDLKITEFKSNEQLSFELNASASYGGFSGSGSFGFSSNDDKEKIVAQFMQRYFSVKVDGSKFPRPQMWFSDETEAQRVLGKTDRGPLLYISQVIYGRCLYLGVESSLSESEVKAALEATYEGTGSASVDSNLQIKKVFNQSKVKYVSIGGAVDSGPVRTLDDFVSLVGDTPTNLNAGGPIAYVFRFVDSNKVAFIQMATTITERNCRPIRKGLETRLTKVINRGNDCELTNGTACSILILAPQSTVEYCASDDAQKVNYAQNLWTIKTPGTFGSIVRREAPDWAKSMACVGYFKFEMKNERDYWEVFEGSNEDLVSKKFKDYFATVNIVDDPKTVEDERNEVGVCIVSTFYDDGENFTKIEYAKLSELRAVGAAKEFVGAEQDLGNGDGWMRYGLQFQFK